MTPSIPAFPLETKRSAFKDAAPKKKPGTEPRAPRAQITRGEHGRYQIKSGLMQGSYVARAFPKAPSSARGVIAEASGATEEAAIAALHEAIDARESERAGARRVDAPTGIAIPSAEEFAEALSQIGLTAPQRAMLTALMLAGTEGLTEARMARASGYKSHASARRSLASAGAAMAAYLASGADSLGTLTGADGAKLVAVHGAAPEEGAEAGNWILHAELRDAVRAAL
ncbi:hypothetical protein [Roseovarius aquimarinus]|uniref:Uncharacterized protein n=1 Tax=Roseovarius aquimarinus TaxID=1229156 RepID=A0ABW7I5I9_9RHOB